MYALLIALLTGGIAGGIARFGGISYTWSAIIGMFAFLAVTIVISQIIRLKIKKLNAGIQQIMEEVQHKIMMMQNQFMRRPPGSQKMMMQVLEKEQNAGIRRAIEACNAFVPLYRWSFLLDRQINTMKMAFYFQLKEFGKVDELMGKCLFFDPQSVCLKMARMYMRKDDGIDKLFKKKCRSLKDPACVLPYSLYAWILVKQERYEEALKLLVECKKKTDNETILRNWEMLANGKYKNFSNSGLGEMWYALGLEEIRIPKQQQKIRYR
ncbi:MAG: hypothetical protein J5858_10655 [Lentisphaeria bacterium]|nr:hypothetical protein [Lentisphaeria bacterium]